VDKALQALFLVVMVVEYNMLQTVAVATDKNRL
jgi:hypothetical protein